MVTMSRFATDYHIARPTGQCAATGTLMEPGATCIATLCEREDDEGFDRFDFSEEAWDRGERPERLYSYWRTVVPHPEEKKNPLVDDEVLLELFTRLAEDERAQRQAFRFVLGLILMRKRLLKFEGRAIETADDGGEREYWFMRAKGTDPETEPMRVANPHLTDDDVRELTDQLSEILQCEL